MSEAQTSVKELKDGTSLWLVKNNNGLFLPLNDSDYEKAKRVPEGEENCFTLRRIRSPRNHRRYFAMLKLIFDNQDVYKNLRNFRLVMQMKAGYFTTEITDKGTAFIPDSIAYEAMDETEFQNLFEKVWIELQKFIQIDRQTLERELAQFA